MLIQPIAAVGLFGIATQLSRGHMVTTILIAMVAMMLTAISYGRMAAVYPSAGSAYTYVGRGLNPQLGFLAGWAMCLDYLIVPVVNTVYGCLTLQRLIPGASFPVFGRAVCGRRHLFELARHPRDRALEHHSPGRDVRGDRGLLRARYPLYLPNSGLDRAFLFHPLLQSVNLPIQLRPHGHFLRGSDLYRL